MLGKSTLFFHCPQCKDNMLVLEQQGKYLCSGCNLDYVELAKDKERLNALLVENMELGVHGIMMVLALHPKITMMSPGESNAYIKDLAQSHGINLPV